VIKNARKRFKNRKLLEIIRETKEDSKDGKLLIFSFFKHTLCYSKHKRKVSERTKMSTQRFFKNLCGSALRYKRLHEDITRREVSPLYEVAMSFVFSDNLLRGANFGCINRFNFSGGRQNLARTAAAGSCPPE
jgi:hypothetical protein